MPWQKLNFSDSQPLTVFARIMQEVGPCCVQSTSVNQLAQNMAYDSQAQLFLFSGDDYELAAGFTYNPTLGVWRGQYFGYRGQVSLEQATEEIMAQTKSWMITDDIQGFYIITPKSGELACVSGFYDIFEQKWCSEPGSTYEVILETARLRVFLAKIALLSETVLDETKLREQMNNH